MVRILAQPRSVRTAFNIVMVRALMLLAFFSNALPTHAHSYPAPASARTAEDVLRDYIGVTHRRD